MHKLLLALSLILLGVGCINTDSPASVSQSTASQEELFAMVRDAIENKAELARILDMRLSGLPDFVLPEQLLSYNAEKGDTIDGYTWGDNLVFAFAEQPNMNRPMRQINRDNIKWVGILARQKGQMTWQPFAEIKKASDTNNRCANKYNPVSMFTGAGRLFVDVANDCGAGSGEGELVRFWTNDGERWVKEGCYYLLPEKYYVANQNNSAIVGLTPFNLETLSACAPVELEAATITPRIKSS